MLKSTRRYFGVEDIALIVLLWTSYWLCTRYEGGFQWSVITTYFMFFLKYFPLSFLLTRLIFYWRAGRAPTQPWLKRVWEFCGGSLPDRRSSVATDLTSVFGTLALAFSLTFYSNVKVRIPFINSTVGDDTFRLIDELLLTDRFIPWLESYVSNRAWLISFLDDVYFHDYKWMVLLVFLFWIRGQRLEQAWLFKSVCLVYITGILLTVLYPSYGPFFFDMGVNGDRFAWLEGTKTFRSQGALMGMWYASQETMSVGKPFYARAFVGIAAFPSLHIAHMTIVCVVARRDFPLLSVVVGIITCVTFVATVAFGWHYAVDAIGGLILGIGIPELVRRLMWSRDGRTKSRKVPAPESEVYEAHGEEE